MKKLECRDCGAPIIFLRDERGQSIPLDAELPVYVVTGDGTCKRQFGARAVHRCQPVAAPADAAEAGSDADAW